MPQSAALYANDTLRELERRAAATFGDDFELMQRAGEAAWRHVLRHWPQALRIVVACGPGNNGGDGHVLAAHAVRAGREVSVLQLSSPATEPARRARAACEAAGVSVSAFEGRLPPADLVVDAVFGIGLSRAPEGAAAALLAAIDAAGCPVLALDVPSGVDGDRGDVPGIAVRATRTLQFMGAHRGLATGAALDHAGERDLCTLDIDPGWLAQLPVAAQLLRPPALAGFLQPRARDSHKGDNGHVLCIGGDHGGGGAILLCAQAALRSGAGLVSVATRDGHVAPLLARQPEAMAHAVDSPAALQPLLQRANAIAIGPGLGRGDWARALFDAALACGKPLLLDADALNLLSESPRGLPAGTILTPHPGEAARLLGCDAAQVQRDRYGAAAALAARYACVVVLKGAGTIVAARDGIPCVVAAGNPGMAVGGMGDLLSGVIGAMIAQGLDAFDAAACGVLLHAAAGDAAARDGMRGMLPSDLLPHLRRCANPAP